MSNKSYPDSLRTSMRQALELVRLLQEERLDKSQRFEQSSQHNDLYVAIPLFAFISHKALTKYFARVTEEDENGSFRDLISNYVHIISEANGILPKDTAASRSCSFAARALNIGQKCFTDKQLLT